MTSLDFLPRTQSECRLVETLIQSEFGIHPTMQARMAGVQRLARWMAKKTAVPVYGTSKVTRDWLQGGRELAEAVVIGGVF